MPRRGTTSSPMAAPAVEPSAPQSGWRGWWSRLRGPAAPAPTHVPAATFDPDLPVETSRRVGPERDIWPDRSQSVLSRLLPTGLTPKLGHNQPAPKMTAAEANRAIASLARPRKTDDDFVLPVRMWDDGDRPTLSPTPTFVDDQAPSASPEPTPAPTPGSLLGGPSTPSRPKLDADARNTSAADRRLEADPSEDVGPPPLVALAQTPPPPPVRPSPRTSPTPPPPPIEASPDATPTEPADDAPPPAASDDPTPEAPTPSLPAAPEPDAPAPGATAAVAPSVPSPTVQAPPPLAAAPQTGWASGQALVAGQAGDATPGRWSFLKWFRPRQAGHGVAHHPGVFPSAQAPAELPPVLVPTSYHACLPASGPPPSRRGVTPTAQQAFVMPTPQCPPSECQTKKPCFLVTRLHERLDQYRHWKHDHICKHIQGLKDMLAGKNRCQACGGTGIGPVPSAQSLPSPQFRPTAPTPQAQARSQSQSWLLFRPGATG